MSKEEKLLARLILRPKDFTYNELRRVMGFLGYIESQSGKTSGSRVEFIEKKRIILFVYINHILIMN